MGGTFAPTRCFHDVFMNDLAQRRLSPMPGICMSSSSLGWQVMKSQIIEQLGQADILLPSLIAEGLAANDRIKVRMSALQAAAHRAQAPDSPATDLHVECRAAGIAPASLATLIGGAHLAGDGRLAAPDLAGLMREIERRRGDDAPRGRRGQIRRGPNHDRAARRDPRRGPARGRRRNRDRPDRETDRRDRGRRRQPAPAGDGSAQVAQPAGRGLRRGDRCRRPCLRPAAGRPCRGGKLHARAERDPRPEIQPSGPRDDGDALGRPAPDPERYRDHRRPCGGDRGREEFA